MPPETTNRPQLGQEAAGGRVVNGWHGPAGGATGSLPRTARAVKSQELAAQAAAAEHKAQALADWHFERANRYLGWSGENPWAAAQYRQHVAAAEFQQRLAARHRAVLAALGGGSRP